MLEDKKKGNHEWPPIDERWMTVENPTKTIL